MSLMNVATQDRYTCQKCNWITSGIILEGKDSHTRWCIKCRSPLFQCGRCHLKTSGTVMAGGVECDNCKETISPSSLIRQ